MDKSAELRCAIMSAMLAITGIADGAIARDQATLAGTYTAHAMEMGGGLLLREDGRFEYGMSYGAIDEAGSGTWRRDGDMVLLTSEPAVKPASLKLVARQDRPNGLVVSLKLPDGFSRQYFSALLTYADGRSEELQLREDGLTLDNLPNPRPVILRLILPIYSVESEVVALPPDGGAYLTFRFDPNDIGKADFRAAPLRIAGDKLLLERFDREIEFVRDDRNDGSEEETR